MFVAVMAFFAKVSDPRSGGTYMTLLNTLSNLGGTWPSTVFLWLVDILTWRNCKFGCKIENEPVMKETLFFNFVNFYGILKFIFFKVIGCDTLFFKGRCISNSK